MKFSRSMILFLWIVVILLFHFSDIGVNVALVVVGIIAIDILLHRKHFFSRYTISLQNPMVHVVAAIGLSIPSLFVYAKLSEAMDLVPRDGVVFFVSFFISGALLSILCQVFTKQLRYSSYPGILFVLTGNLIIMLGFGPPAIVLISSWYIGALVLCVTYFYTKTLIDPLFFGIVGVGITLLVGFLRMASTNEMLFYYLWIFAPGSAALIPYMIQRHRAKRAAATLPPAGGEGEGA